MEKALIEEWLWIVLHLVNAEEHLIEAAAKSRDREDALKLIDLADKVRVYRREILRSLLDKIGSEIPDSEGSRVIRDKLDNIWCTVKHLLSAAEHALETAQKLAEEGDLEGALRMAKLSAVAFKKAVELITPPQVPIVEEREVGKGEGSTGEAS